MADKDTQLDPGFEEVQLDPGFQEVPVDQQADTSTSDVLKESATDVGRGLYQGATLGFGPSVLSPAVGATAQKVEDVLSGQQGQDWLKSYYEKQKTSQAAQEESKARSPYLYGGGEVAGILLPALATSGAGLAAAGGEAAELGAGKLIGKALLERTLPTAATAGKIVGGLAETAGTGALLGGAQALGTSKGSLQDETQRQKLGSDVLSGIEMGAVAGPLTESALGVAGAAKSALGQKAAQYAEDSPLLRQIFKSRQLGLQGVPVTETESALSRMGGEQVQAIRDVTNKFLNAESRLGKALQNSIDQATEDGVTVDVSDPVREAISGLSQTLKEHQNVLGPRQVSGLVQQLDNLQSGIKESLENAVPGLKDLSERFSALRRAGSETILAKGEPAELADVWVGDLSNPKGRLSQAVTDMLEKATVPGTAKMEARRTLSELVNNLNEYEQNYPGLLDKLGIDPSTIGKEITDKADQFAIAKQAVGYEPQSNPLSTVWGLMGGGATTGRGQLISKANLIGRAEGAIKKPILDVGQALFNLPKEGLQQIGETMRVVPGLQSLGDALLAGLQDPNPAKRNAAMFSIMQNPKARSLLTGSMENKSQDETLKPSGSTASYE